MNIRAWRAVTALGALVLGLVGLVLVDFGAESGAASVLFLVLMALPSYAALIIWLGWRRGAVLLGVLTVLPLLVEAAAVATGVPYGSFAYADALGWKVFGLVPWTVGVAYPPVFLGAVTAAGILVGPTLRRFLPASALLLVAADLVLDPAAVSAGFWAWENLGIYYGIPVVNFVGWAITGVFYAWVFHRGAGGSVPPPSMSSSAVLIFGFWTGYLLRESLLFPAFMGAALVALFLLLPTGHPREGPEG
ncbi:carotenoid biosynthesis protein [Methanofollis aquaemaris]|uniref:Carotenoid biosynthesis protein n=1 Tax=Methanofollis aquaemaris TaxID=126734 RepID=A0A8A3S4F3_9EURY|nr:carotenoid biosynthesis protein [Methanofollis aquaemaris]QSZ66942.1 carotenoid biosynthesis protein [Methanofollis aquaemaris]